MRRFSIFLVLLFSSLLTIFLPSFTVPSVYAAEEVIIVPDPAYEDSSGSRVQVQSSDMQTNIASDSSSDSDQNTKTYIFFAVDQETEYETDLQYDYDQDFLYETEHELEEDTQDETETESWLQSDNLSETAGTDAILVIDVSGSMKQSDPDYLCKKAALDFIDQISQGDHSRVGLITFCDTIQNVVPLTPLHPGESENEVISQLNSFAYTNGDTDIGTALRKASDILLSDSSDSRARSILLLTDGEIDLPGAQDEEEAEKESLTHALIAVDTAKKNKIVIHTVSLDLSDSMNINLMNYMADSTGGTASHVRSPIELGDVFEKLSVFAKKQAKEHAMAQAMTEAETEPETEKEEETETEELIPVVRTSGTISGPVHLKGLLPNMCQADLNLSNLFYLDQETADGSTLENNLSDSNDPGQDSFHGSSPLNHSGDEIIYTAYTDDRQYLNCKVEDGILSLSGLKNGTTNVNIYAEPALGNTDDNQQAMITFPVTINALIPSPFYLILIPGIILIAAGIVWLLRRPRKPKTMLSGTLQWYVRGENEKIFGIPSQLYADLSEYGDSVRLSDMIQDELVLGAELNKVIISASEDGITVSSRSKACMLQSAENVPSRRIEIPSSGRFKVLCETDRGRAAVIAFYSSEPDQAFGASDEDDEDERTRMLV